jgi:hypothetical protein
MDGITFDQFQTAFGDPLTDLKKGIDKLCNTQTNQVDLLTKLQQLIGQKVDTITDYQKEITKKTNELTGYAKELNNSTKNSQNELSINKTTGDKSTDRSSESLLGIKLVPASIKTIPSSLKVLPVRIVNDESNTKEKNNKGPFSGITDMFSGIFGEPKSAKSSYSHESVNLLIPSETEVQLQNIIGDTLKPYFDRQDHKAGDLLDVTNDIHKLILNQGKKTADEPWWKKLLGPLLFLGPLLSKLITGIPGLLLGIGKQIIPLIGKLLGPLMPLLSGAGLAIAGILTLINGIKDSGPYKGLKKLLGKGLLNVGLSLIRKEFNKLAKLGTEVLSAAASNIKKSFRSMSASLIKISKKIFSGSVIKSLVDGFETGASKLFSTLKGIPGKIFGTISKTIKSLFGGFTEKVGGGILSKLGGGAMKGFVGKLLGVALKIFKKIPIIGSLITIGFAVSRFKNGDTIGGGLEVLSGIASLFPGIGTGVSIAIDALNAVLDYKSGGATGKQQGAKMSIIKDMLGWLYKKIKYVPILGPLFGMGTAVMEGNWGEALKQLAKGLFPPLGIIVDLFENKEAVGKAVTKSVDFIGSISKWLFDRFKYVPVFGPLMGMVESMTEGKWLDAFGYLAKAAIPPLGILVDLLDNKEAVGQAAAATGDWLGQAASWVYNKAKSIPVIGPLIKAGEAIAGGKWDEVLGFLGEAIEPLQYIGSLIAGGVKSAAINVGGGIADFFTSMKDSLLRAVLFMIPDITIGTFSLRKTVAGLLGITDISTSAPSAPATIAVNPKTGAQTVSSQTSNQPNNTVPVDTTQDQSQRSVSSIKPTENNSRTMPDTNDNSNEDFEGMHGSIKEHTGYLKGLILYQKQTAENTKLLIEALKNSQLNTNKTVNLNTINSPTSFISGPASSTSFRASMAR